MALSQEPPAKGPKVTNQKNAAAPARKAEMLRRAALVQHAPLFADISQTECREIVSRARERQYRRHQTIFLEGDPARNVILLMHGNIKIMQLGQIGSEVILRVVWSGDLVGEEGLSLQSKHRSTAQPLDDATVLVWDTSVFVALADRFPLLRRNLQNIVSQRLEELEERYREVSTANVAARLSHALVRLATKAGHRTKTATEIHLSREELAQLTGTTFFTVGRLLSEWAYLGLVSVRRETVSVQNIEALKELAFPE